MARLDDRPPTCRRTPEAVEVALASAQTACRTRGLQFTAFRQATLEALSRSRLPIGAYDLIRILEEKLERPVSPPTVYRTLEFLLEQGFIARIATKNAYVACAHPDHPHSCVFFICEHCGTSAEVENEKAEALLARDAASLGFRIGKRVIELQGTCADCLSAGVSA